MNNRVVPTAAADDAEDDVFVETVNKRPFEDIIHTILNNMVFSTLVTLLTIFALFGDDVRIAFCEPSMDQVFFTLSIVALVVFTGELTISCVGKPNYMFEKGGIMGLGFYFLLDGVSTVSLIPDTNLFSLSGGDDGDGTDNRDALKAGRASKASKATRVIRLVRLVRMVRIVKLYKMHGAQEEVEEDTNEDDIEPTTVGKKLNEQTTRKLIVMILATVVILPWLSADGVLGFAVDDFYCSNGLSNLYATMTNTNLTFIDGMRSDYINNLRGDDNTPLVYLNLCPDYDPNVEFSTDAAAVASWGCTEEFPNPDYKSLDDIRKHLRGDLAAKTDKNIVEYQLIVPPALAILCDPTKPDECPVFAIALVDLKFKSTLSIVKTLLVMVILVVGSLQFARDAKGLVLDPIERMVNVVNRLSENPLAKTDDMMVDPGKDDKNKYETQLLEQTIVKIGQMLQIGFGAAGAAIIGKNMKAGALNCMVPGKMITSIYGFCDIRNFTDTTECLQEEVMVYVNKIGFMVHGCTNDYYGMANKNVGDAFLLSWKICDDLLPGFTAFEDKPDEEARAKAAEAVSVVCKGAGNADRRITPTELADSALCAFLKCLVDMDNANTNGSLSCYLVHQRVVKRFGTNFRIKMGFGMHVGWAIEGAIGTSYKIDATYMSPHVEMTDRLEAGSKIFGVPINISHWLYALLSPQARNFLRPIDRIMVEGCPTPMTVYTYDVVHYPKTFGEAKMEEDGVTQKAVDFGNDPQFHLLQQGLHPAFLDNARKGVKTYLAGDWPEAKVIMEMALGQKPQDGPLLRLLGIMSEHNFVAPSDWPGYYELLEGY